jgi:hypothetical protein
MHIVALSVTRFLRQLFLPALLLLACAAQAQTPRDIGWRDLMPPRTEVSNPFAKLTAEQQRALLDLATLRDRAREGSAALSEGERADERALSAQLKRDGLDVESLLATRNRMLEAHRARARAVNPQLDGQLVRIAGYLLPLEFSGKSIREFLLVPWVGACIHTPPPPANQIVHVTLEQAFEHDGLFKPVVVTGRMSARESRRSVFVVDGTSDVEVSYLLRGIRVSAHGE